MKDPTRELETLPKRKSANPRPVSERLAGSRVKSPEKLKRPRGTGGCRMLKSTRGFHSAPNFSVWRPLITLKVSIKSKTFSNFAGRLVSRTAKVCKATNSETGQAAIARRKGNARNADLFRQVCIRVKLQPLGTQARVAGAKFANDPR